MPPQDLHRHRLAVQSRRLALHHDERNMVCYGGRRPGTILLGRSCRQRWQYIQLHFATLCLRVW